MRRRLRHAIRLAVLLAIATLLACSFEASFEASVSFRISTSARVFTHEATEQAEVNPEDVKVPAEAVQTLEIKPGVLLVSEDFVRRVVSAETVDGKVVAHTERASLEEVIEQGEWASTYDLGSDPALTEKWAQLSPKATWSGRGFEVAIGKRSIVLDEATNARVWIDGSLSFRPSIDLKLKFGPTYAHAIARGDLNAKLNVAASASVAKAYVKSVVLWESPPFSMPLGWIGPVPIRFQAKLAVRAILRVSASGSVVVTTGFDFHADGGYGFRYEGGRMREVNEWNANGEVYAPKIASAAALDIRAALRAEIDGGLNGDVWLASATGGLRLSAEMYANAHVDPSTWRAELGVRADARAYLRVVALWWDKEWETAPLTIMEKSVMTWTPTSSTPTVTAACTGGIVTCGPSFDPRCPKCATGGACVVNSDCASNVCVGGFCWASPLGEKAAGDACTSDANCALGSSCNFEVQPTKELSLVCRPDRCGNEKSDGDESDRDCGGSCRPCNVGFACRTPSDCASGVCRLNLCAAR